MASADVQILGSGSKAAPLDYNLPSGSELLLKAVHADFDGSGAGSAFLPALEIISDAGHVVGVYPADVAVAAGASASVSFAPFLRNAPAAAAIGVDRIFAEGVIYSGTNTVNDSVEKLIFFGTAGGCSFGDGCPVEFGDDSIRFTALAGGKTYFARLSVLWNASFAGYRYVAFGYAAPAGAVSNMEELIFDLVDQNHRSETSKQQFQRLEVLIPAYVFTAGRYLELKCYAYQESGGPQGLKAECEIYSVQAPI